MNKLFHGALVFLAALCLCTATYGGKEEEAAEQKFNIQMTLALNNDPKAQYQVAEMYEQGIGIPQNLRMAYLWYMKSAKQNYAPAVKKLATWDNEKNQDEALAAKRAEEQKRRQAEADAAAVKAAQARAEEQKRRQAEAAAVKAAPAAVVGPAIPAKPVETDRSKEKSEDTAVKSEQKSDGAEFRANPCNTPTAKFTSTCQ